MRKGGRVTSLVSLVVLVSGMAVSEPGIYLNKLTSGLKELADTRHFRFEPDNPDGSGDSTRFEAEIDGTSGRVDFVECYWSDLRPRLSGESGLKKLLGGLALFVFWVASPKVWARSLRSKYMLLNCLPGRTSGATRTGSEAPPSVDEKGFRSASLRVASTRRFPWRASCRERVTISTSPTRASTKPCSKSVACSPTGRPLPRSPGPRRRATSARAR